MSTDNVDAIALIEQLPDGVSVETIITELRFRATNLRRAAEAGRREKLIRHDQVKRRIESGAVPAMRRGRS